MKLKKLDMASVNKPVFYMHLIDYKLPSDTGISKSELLENEFSFKRIN
jgi:hypothetical protein